MLRQLLLVTTLFLSVNTALAADPIPDYLTGVWASKGAVLQDNQMLVSGQALYLNNNGKAAMVVAYPPIGLEAQVQYDEKTQVLNFDVTDGREHVRTAVTYDEKKKVLIFNDEDQVRLMIRHVERLSPETIRYLHLE